MDFPTKFDVDDDDEDMLLLLLLLLCFDNGDPPTIVNAGDSTICVDVDDTALQLAAVSGDAATRVADPATSVAAASAPSLSNERKLRGGLRRKPKRFESSASADKRFVKAIERDMDDDMDEFNDDDDDGETAAAEVELAKTS